MFRSDPQCEDLLQAEPWFWRRIHIQDVAFAMPLLQSEDRTSSEVKQPAVPTLNMSNIQVSDMVHFTFAGASVVPLTISRCRL